MDGICVRRPPEKVDTYHAENGAPSRLVKGIGSCSIGRPCGPVYRDVKDYIRIFCQVLTLSSISRLRPFQGQRTSWRF